jgi:GNAT superfamily N-acetyltransferase
MTQLALAIGGSALHLGSFSAQRVKYREDLHPDWIDFDECKTWAFQCETTSPSGTSVALHLNFVEMLPRIENCGGGIKFQMCATDGDRVVSRKKVSTGGVSFVWLPHEREVKDIRVYVAKSFQRQGYGSLIVSFVKAFFFIHYTDSMATGSFAIPLGGYRGARVLTVLPASTPAYRFYKNLDFRPDPLKLRNKWTFEVHHSCNALLLEPKSLDVEAVLAKLFALPSSSRQAVGQAP